MFTSLRLRLFLAFIALVTVALGAVAFFAGQATTHEFQRYVERGGLARRGRFEAVLAVYYSQVGSWHNVQPIVDQMGQISGERIVLADGWGRVIADSGRTLEGQLVGRDWVTPVALVKGGRTVGLLYVSPPEGPAPGAGENTFLRSVRRSLWLAVLIAGLAAVFLTNLLSRRILKPVESLTAAVRRMEKGDLTQRVEVESQDEIGELAGAFNAMAGGLARAEDLRRNMVSDVAHELRTPLTNIRGNLEALRDGVLDPTPEVVDSLYEEAMLLGRLVDDLQELALVESGSSGWRCSS